MPEDRPAKALLQYIVSQLLRYYFFLNLRKMKMGMNKVGSFDVISAASKYGKQSGLGWFTAALFLIADMAGGGIVALPVAMVRSGRVF